MMLAECIKKILKKESLSIDEAQIAMDEIMTGNASPVQISAFLVALKQKGESVNEVTGFVSSMRKHSIKIKSKDNNAVDGCGTGGDGAHTFNISTAAVFVASSVGVTVAKHGNRSVSSKCGSADILEVSGGNIDPGIEITEKNLNDVGFCFMFAPRFHPAMKYAGPVRKELGVRTVFNILGPMTNPASVTRQVIGVYNKSLMPLMAEVLMKLNSNHVLIVHSKDGLDEFSVSAPTEYIELKNGIINSKIISSDEVGLGQYQLTDLAGGDVSVNMEIFSEVLSGQKSAYRDTVLFNAGALVYVSGKSESIKDGVAMAKEALNSGKSKDKLDQWVKVSNI